MSDAPFESNEKEEKNQNDNDWENRILCSDESCIGVIGPDGRCKECGKPYAERPAPETQTAETESGAGDEIDPSKASVKKDDWENKKDDWENKKDDWENRTLCSDESCIGVIGPDGLCKECGKPYQG